MAIKKLFSNFPQRRKEKIVVGFWLGAYLFVFIFSQFSNSETFGNVVPIFGLLGVAFFLAGMYFEKNREEQYDSGIFKWVFLAGVVLAFVFFKIGSSVENERSPFSGAFSPTFVYIYLVFMFIAFKAGIYKEIRAFKKLEEEDEESEYSIWLCNNCASEIEADVYYCPKCGKYLRGFGKKTKKSQ